jgi:group I intron endonuclease
MENILNKQFKHSELNQIPLGISGIYKMANIINGRFYVGQAYCLRRRLIEHVKILNKNKDSVFLQNDYNKLNKDITIFSFEIIETCENVEDLNKVEQKYLDLYWDNKNICYNIAKYVISPSKGIKFSEETKNKMRNSQLGRKHSEETKRKIGLGQKGKKIRIPKERFVKVYQYDLEGNFLREHECITYAAKFLKENSKVGNPFARIQKVCKLNKNLNEKKYTNRAYGFVWTYDYHGPKIEVFLNKVYTDEERKMYGEILKKAQDEYKKSENFSCSGARNSHAKKVKQYDLKGNLIKIWGCMKDAANEVGVDLTTISSCCKQKRKNTRKFIWRFINDEF